MAYHPFRHLGLKFLAISLATLLWLTVAGEHLVERGMRIPLEYRNKPPELEIVGDPPTVVDVRLSGSSAVLSRLSPGEIVAVVDLAGARSGSRLIPLHADEVRVPYGVEVQQIVPTTLALQLEKSARRTVSIVPAVEGEPAPGYAIGRVTPEPSTVEVIGPESRLKDLTGATTEPISVNGRTATIRETVTVGVTDSSVRLVEARAVNVTVEVVPSPVEREVTGVPVRWRNLGAGLSARITPSLATVAIRGQRDTLQSLRSDAIEAFVDLAGLGSGRYNLQVRVDPSQSFGVIEVSPAVVDVIIK